MMPSRRVSHRTACNISSYITQQSHLGLTRIHCRSLAHWAQSKQRRSPRSPSAHSKIPKVNKKRSASTTRTNNSNAEQACNNNNNKNNNPASKSWKVRLSMHHVLIVLLLALTLYTSASSSARTLGFILEGSRRVSLCEEAIESVLDPEHEYYTQQHPAQFRRSLPRALSGNATTLELPLLRNHSITMNRAMQAKADAAIAAEKRNRRSRLISEMAKDCTKTSDSVASSTGSKHGTVSPDSTIASFDSMNFHPEMDGVINSTGPLNNEFSLKLPKIRDTAKKCGRWAPRPQNSYVIDTSAIGRAFPDFSGGIESDDDFSIEIGRANVARPANNTIYTDHSNNENSPIINLNNQQILRTPHNVYTSKSGKPYLEEIPRSNSKQNIPNSKIALNVEKESTFNRALKAQVSHKRQPTNQERQFSNDTFSNEQKENIPPPKTTSPYTSNASRVIDGKRKTLHARVADESDIMDSTRSSLPPQLQQEASQISFQPDNSSNSPRLDTWRADRKEASHNSSLSKVERRIPTSSTAFEASFSKSRLGSWNPPAKSPLSAKPLVPNPTQSSFIIPPIHEVSATFDIGIPVSVQKGAVQFRKESSRSGRDSKYERVDAFVLPEDEEDIYEMCEMQKARIAQLEKEHDLFEQRIRELEMQSSQFTYEKNQWKIEKTNWDSHQCGDAKLEMKFAQLNRDHSQLKLEKVEWQSHVCVDDQLSVENAQLKFQNAELKLEKAQFNQTKKSWDAHKCIDHGLQTEIAQLKVEKQTWEKHECRDRGLEKQFAQLVREKEALDAQHTADLEKTAQIQQDLTRSHASDAYLDQLAENLDQLKKEHKTQKLLVKDRVAAFNRVQKENEQQKSIIREQQTKHAQTIRELETLRAGVLLNNVHKNETEISQQRLRSRTRTTSRTREETTSHSEKANETVRSSSRKGEAKSTIQNGRRPSSSHVRRSRKDDLTSAFLIPDIVGDIGDEPTLRPTMGPDEALGCVSQSVRDEIEELKAQLAEMHEKYAAHNGAISERKRLRIEGAIKRLVDEISKKSHDLYLLYDVELGYQGEGGEEATQQSLPWEGVEDETEEQA